MKQKAKRIIYDIVGLFLVILSPFLGAIPGPGGILVFFAGLSILAVHNEWAAKLLEWAKNNITNLVDLIFVNNKKVQLLNDVIGIVLISISVASYLLLSPPFTYIITIASGAAGIFWLVRNRNRYKFFIRKR